MAENKNTLKKKTFKEVVNEAINKEFGHLDEIAKKDEEIKNLKKGIVNYFRESDHDDGMSDKELIEDVILSYATGFYPDLEGKSNE